MIEPGIHLHHQERIGAELAAAEEPGHNVWTAPVTHATGDVFPAADWNTYVRDNLNQIHNVTVSTASPWTPPASPSSGDLWDIQPAAGSGDGRRWRFVYQAGFSYPWVFVGGTWDKTETSGNAWRTTASAWGLLDGGTGGTLTWTAPRSGIYQARFGGEIYQQGAGSGGQFSAVMGVVFNSTAGAPTRSARLETLDPGTGKTNSGAFAQTASFTLTAGDVARLLGFQNTGVSSAVFFQNYWMEFRPIGVQ